MSHFAILALRALVILIGLGALILQLVLIFPVYANTVANESDVTILPVPYAVLGVALAVCVEVALVAVWVLLSMVRRGAIFTQRAFRWVDAIIVAGLAATVLVLAFGIHLIGVAMRDDAPGVIVFVGGAVMAGMAFVLLMVVMRGLLRSATALQSELAEVV
ncbi:DUF2975 domain-containing protein [Saxibacter everestensis]|uniref:DUF2975 domain-containing protein n=1 Tax=Saxibacter everestensis TaxID=2909229 RepID=A0ABY8QVS9_9MICO|nr:DUF2975 domain-containing protein [Brevibacteriaceae bacterium ZFBP1038]